MYFGLVFALKPPQGVTPGNKPGLDDILWKAKSVYKMWQLLHSILNMHTSTQPGSYTGNRNWK